MSESYMSESYISLLLDCPNPPSKRQIYNMKYYYDVVKPKRQLLTLEKKLKYNCEQAQLYSSEYSVSKHLINSHISKNSANAHINESLNLVRKIIKYDLKTSQLANLVNKMNEIKMCMNLL